MDYQLDWVKHYKGAGNNIVGLNARDDQNALVIVGLKTERRLLK